MVDQARATAMVEQFDASAVTEVIPLWPLVDQDERLDDTPWLVDGRL